jgi:hypothetical protein
LVLIDRFQLMGSTPVACPHPVLLHRKDSSIGSRRKNMRYVLADDIADMDSEAGNDYHDTVRFPLLAWNVSYSKCRTRV